MRTRLSDGRTRRALPLAAGLALVFASGAFLPDADARRRARGFGFLEVKSTTEGAQVLIDGEPVGTVPLANKLRLRVGKHTIKITRRGYTQFLDVVKIKRRKTTTMDIDLLPVSGIFVIKSSEADARVFVDGKYVGNAPVEVDVNMGKRAIRVRKAGFYDYITHKDATAGEVTTVDASLKQLPVGTTPYRPPPPPPPKWYEKWYVWAGAAGGLAAVAVAVAVPIVIANQDDVADFNPDHRWRAE